MEQNIGITILILSSFFGGFCAGRGIKPFISWQWWVVVIAIMIGTSLI